MDGETGILSLISAVMGLLYHIPVILERANEPGEKRKTQEASHVFLLARYTLSTASRPLFNPFITCPQ